MKAHAGLEENSLADAVAKQVVTQKVIDACGNLNDLPNEDPAAAGIHSTCNVSNNAHKHDEWPLYPSPEHEGVDEKALCVLEVLPSSAPRRDMARWLWPGKGARLLRDLPLSANLSCQMPARTMQQSTSGRPDISQRCSPRL